MYNIYKRCFERERYVDVLWMEVYRNSLAHFRMGVSQINLHRNRFSTTADNTTCRFCANQQETEIHFVFQCPVYNQLKSKSSKYLPDIINVHDPRKYLLILMLAHLSGTICLKHSATLILPPLSKPPSRRTCLIIISKLFFTALPIPSSDTVCVCVCVRACVRACVCVCG